MIKLNINHTSINASNLETLVEGNIKSLFVKFIFSSEWEHLARVAVFTNGETKVSLSLNSDTCAIPWEVLTSPGEVVISLRGLGNSGEYVICTENKSLGKVEKSNANANVSDAEEATPDVIETLLANFAEIMEAGGVAGEDGKSAYELAVDNGFVGTEVQWLTSLKGADGINGTNGINGIDGANGENGTDGKSAYEIAVEHGYTGTEVQWLASLKGANGENGVDGTNGADGIDGKSAYQIAVEHGYTGTEVQWLASLKGADGENGVDGVNGTNGVDGKSAYELAVDHGYTGTEVQWLASLNGADSIPTRRTITLLATNWVNSQQTVTVQGILADETAQLIQPVPAAANIKAYCDSGILATAQSLNALTFSCVEVPENDITVYVIITEVRSCD